MSTYRLQQGMRELYITDGNLRQTPPRHQDQRAGQTASGSPSRQQAYQTSLPGFSPVVYNNSDLDADLEDSRGIPRSAGYTSSNVQQTYSPNTSQYMNSGGNPNPGYTTNSNSHYMNIGTDSSPGYTASSSHYVNNATTPKTVYTANTTHFMNIKQDGFSAPDPRYSPPPPPYSAIAREREYVSRGGRYAEDDLYPPHYQTKMNVGYNNYSNVINTSGNADNSLQQRSPSPFQERNDVETLVPTYTTPYNPNKYPEGAPSRIVYTTQGPPAGKQYVQSRPMNPGAGTGPAKQPGPRAPMSQPQHPPAPRQNAPPTFNYGQQPRKVSPTSSVVPTSPTRIPEARPYQLKPTLDLYKNERSPNAPLPGKEEEVDALTSLLMQNMDASADTDYFGYCDYCGNRINGALNACTAFGKVYHINCFGCHLCGMCANCGNPILGQDTGCKALDQPFHIKCFVCVTCDVCLKGQPFYAMDGKPYCEGCYMNTLEKCSVCSKPITERILRATGKPYHPGCFTCVVCGKSLDGIPFTVDATNQIHCIEDFHKKFAPRCCVCGHPIMPETGVDETVRIVAMDRSFHIQCYRCEDCGLQLSSEADGRGCYPLDEHILCKSCNAKRIQTMTTKMTTEL